MIDLTSMDAGRTRNPAIRLELSCLPICRLPPSTGSMLMQRTLVKAVTMCSKVSVSDKEDVTEICTEGIRCYRVAVSVGYLPRAEATACVLELGLLREHSETMLVPIPPTTAALLLMEPIRQEISHRQQVIAALEPSVAAAAEAYCTGQEDRLGGLRTLRDAETISSLLQISVNNCLTEMLTIQPGGQRPPELLARALDGELDALRRGVRQRTIYQHAIRSHAPTMDYLRTILSAGGEVRTTDEVVDRLIIFDRRVAFIPTGAERTDSALEIRNPAVVRFLVGVFENAWHRARDVAAGPTPRPAAITDETQGAILHIAPDVAAVRRLKGVNARCLCLDFAGVAHENARDWALAAQLIGDALQGRLNQCEFSLGNQRAV